VAYGSAGAICHFCFFFWKQGCEIISPPLLLPSFLTTCIRMHLRLSVPLFLVSVSLSSPLSLYICAQLIQLDFENVLQLPTRRSRLGGDIPKHTHTHTHTHTHFNKYTRTKIYLEYSYTRQESFIRMHTVAATLKTETRVADRCSLHQASS